MPWFYKNKYNTSNHQIEYQMAKRVSDGKIKNYSDTETRCLVYSNSNAPCRDHLCFTWKTITIQYNMYIDVLFTKEFAEG